MRIIPPNLGVAIIDDERAVRTTLTRLLRSFGMNAEAYASGAEFLTCLKAGNWQVVLLDTRLRDLTGFEVLRRIRQERPELAVIMITGDERPDLRRRALEAGAQAFLLKPFPLAELLDVVRALPDDSTLERP